jgi:hypothetical protein
MIEEQNEQHKLRFKQIQERASPRKKREETRRERKKATFGLSSL